LAALIIITGGVTCEVKGELEGSGSVDGDY
jgi:hypothetical protein